MLCYSQADCVYLGSFGCLHKHLLWLLMPQFFSLPYFLCHFPVPEQISVLIQVYRDQLLMCYGTAWHRAGLWWLSQRNEGLCFYPCAHLQAEEEGRRPALRTLHVGLCEVRRAASARRLIKGVIWKAKSKSHGTNMAVVLQSHTLTSVQQFKMNLFPPAASPKICKTDFGTFISATDPVHWGPNPNLCNRVGIKDFLHSSLLVQASSAARGCWADPRPCAWSTVHRELPSVSFVCLAKHTAAVGRASPRQFCHPSKPQTLLRLLSKEGNAALQVLILLVAK